VARTLPVNELVTVIVHVSAEAPGTADRPVATAAASTTKKRRGRVRLRITALELPRNNILYAALPGVVQGIATCRGYDATGRSGALQFGTGGEHILIISRQSGYMPVEARPHAAARANISDSRGRS
jgi:hypothetical protein